MARIQLQPYSFSELRGILCGLSFLVLSFISLNTSAQGLPRPDHIVILIEENQTFAEILDSAFAPTDKSVAKDTNSAVFTQMYAIEHPSQPNYLDFFSGSNQGVEGPNGDNLPQNYPFTTDNLARELLDKGLTFVTYSQDLDNVGNDEVTSVTGSYVRKHNPVTNWVGTGLNQVPDTLNQTYATFPVEDYSNLPTVAYVVPDEDSDMHNDGLAGIPIGDYWFCEHMQCVNSYIDWAQTHNSLFILTFDEDDGTDANNIPTIFTGPMVKGGQYSDHWTLYNILRTIEDMYGLRHAGAAATSIPILNVWKSQSTGIDGVSPSSQAISVYPDPASSVTNFDCSGLSNRSGELFINDVTGRQITGLPLSDSKSLSVNTSTYPAGIYFYHLVQNGALVESGKFIVAR